jgi:hypothetical protein
LFVGGVFEGAGQMSYNDATRSIQLIINQIQPLISNLKQYFDQLIQLLLRFNIHATYTNETLNRSFDSKFNIYEFILNVDSVMFLQIFDNYYRFHKQQPMSISLNPNSTPINIGALQNNDRIEINNNVENNVTNQTIDEQLEKQQILYIHKQINKSSISYLPTFTKQLIQRKILSPIHVYDLTIKNNFSFVANQCIVHNCNSQEALFTPLSPVPKKIRTNKSDTKSPTKQTKQITSIVSLNEFCMKHTFYLLLNCIYLTNNTNLFIDTLFSYTHLRSLFYTSLITNQQLSIRNLFSSYIYYLILYYSNMDLNIKNKLCIGFLNIMMELLDNACNFSFTV